MEEALNEHKKVYKLDLSLSNLTAVPEGIEKMKCLQVLDLQDNKIEELPEKLTKLKKLQYPIACENGEIKALEEDRFTRKSHK